MNKYGLYFHHHGLAVKSPEKAIRFLTGLGYSIGESVFDEFQNVRLMMCSHSELPEVELIYPKGDAIEAPLDKILKVQNEAMYHTCYGTNDLTKTLQAIKADGNRVMPISPRKPAILFSNQLVSFYYIAGWGLIEILEDR